MNIPTVIESVAPQFTVSDVVRTAEYYRDVFGFEVRGYWGEPPVFSIVARDCVELFFNLAAPDTVPRTGRVDGGYDAYFKVRGVEALAVAMKKQGAEVIEGPEVREYGMVELVVRDCNGLILAFGEEVPAAPPNNTPQTDNDKPSC